MTRSGYMFTHLLANMYLLVGLSLVCACARALSLSFLLSLSHPPPPPLPPSLSLPSCLPLSGSLLYLIF